MSIERRNCPYSNLAETSFWKSAVGDLDIDDVRPFVAPVPLIHKTSRVASAGSCFAQFISRHLRRWGYNYLVTESGPPWLSARSKATHSYGVYSARFGNIYTVRQLRQLAERALKTDTTEVPLWQLPDGRIADPLRPRVEPGGFVSAAECLRDRRQHLSAVREMFENLDVLVFTLGLTEGWRDIGTGAMLPVCPGCGAGGAFDANAHEFVNFSVSEIVSDLERTLALLSSVNPGGQVILTVSPVPLAATFEGQHVLPATVYSKSVLRVACEDVVKRYENVHYFASYEMVTAVRDPKAFQADGRQVNEPTVRRVMRAFAAQFCSDPDIPVASVDQKSKTRRAKQRETAATEAEAVLCDEDLIISALQRNQTTP